MGGHSKGSQFERDICRLLSDWWSGGERDDIFWRSAASGAMGKIRSKSGKKTFGQYGDISATDPIGRPLLDLCSIELKRGYRQASLIDVIDSEDKAKQIWQTFLEQVLEDHTNAGVPYWLLITKRNRRVTLVYMPYEFFTRLSKETCSSIRKGVPYIRASLRLTSNRMTIVGVRLREFLARVSPKDIRRLHAHRLARGA